MKLILQAIFVTMLKSISRYQTLEIRKPMLSKSFVSPLDGASRLSFNSAFFSVATS